MHDDGDGRLKCSGGKKYMDGFDAELAKAPEIFASPMRRPHVRMNVVFAHFFTFFFHLPEGHLGRFTRRFSGTQPRKGFSFSAVT